MCARGKLIFHEHIVELFLIDVCLALQSLPVEALDVLEVLDEHFGGVEFVGLV